MDLLTLENSLPNYGIGSRIQARKVGDNSNYYHATIFGITPDQISVIYTEPDESGQYIAGYLLPDQIKDDLSSNHLLFDSSLYDFSLPNEVFSLPPLTPDQQKNQKCFDQCLELAEDNKGGGDCFYHCMMFILKPDYENNLSSGSGFRNSLHKWLTQTDDEDKTLQEVTTLLQNMNTNDTLFISNDGIKYENTNLAGFLLGLQKNAWADNIITVIVSIWMENEFDKYFVIWDDKRKTFLLKNEMIPTEQVEGQMHDDRFHFIWYNGIHYRNLCKK